MASPHKRSKPNTNPREVNESFTLLYKYASLVRTYANKRSTFRDFSTRIDGREVRENLEYYISRFLFEIDFSDLQANVHIIEIHWKSIRNYLPLLLRFPVAYADRDDSKFLKSLKRSILFSTNTIITSASELKRSLEFNRRIVNNLREFVNVHERLGIFPKDEVDNKISHIIGTYDIALNEILSEKTQKHYDEVAEIVAMLE